MNLRVYRTFEWVVPRRPLGEIRFGGPPPAKVLKTTETLQFFDAIAEEWKDVAIVEALKPPYPAPTDRHPATGHFEQAFGLNQTGREG